MSVEIISRPVRWGLAGVLATFAGSALAQQAEPPTAPHQIEVYVSEDALQAMYIRQTNVVDDLEATLQGAVFVSEARDIVGMVSALSQVADPQRYPRWTFEVGARGYGALLDGEDQDVFGLALGGQARYQIGGNSDLAAAFGLFYAPDILTFGQADSVYDTFFRLESTLRDGLVAFVGYRLLEFDLAQNRELDDHAHLGIRWAF